MERKSINFLTHNNGARPYLVKIKQNRNRREKKGTCLIYKKPKSKGEYSDFDFGMNDIDRNGNEVDNLLNYMEHIKTYNFIEWFDGDDSEYLGNSILLNLNNTRYVFIGDRFFEFESYGKIVKFSSMVGNNDVPYPYAIDDKGYIYLLIENAIVEMDEGFENCNDIYWEYYTRTDKHQAKKGQRPMLPVRTVPWKNVECIK